MACDTCGKKCTELVFISEYVQKYLPYKYYKTQVCKSCEKKLNDELDKYRSLAWGRVATLLVEMVDKIKPTQGAK